MSASTGPASNSKTESLARIGQLYLGYYSAEPEETGEWLMSLERAVEAHYEKAGEFAASDEAGQLAEANEVKRLQAIIDDARDMTGPGPDVLISRTLLKTMAAKVAQADSLNDRLETLLKKTRKTLRITYCADPVGNSWSADLGDWPFCSSGTIPHAIESLVNRHGQLEKEELQKRINEIDQSASL